MRIVYVLPKPDFFARGRRGRVAHAVGVIHGLVANGCHVTVISGPGTNAAVADMATVRVVEIDDRASLVAGRWRWTTRLIELIEDEIGKKQQADAIIIRYASSNAFRFLSLLSKPRRQIWCVEVNSLAYHSLHRLPRWFRLLVRRFELFTLGNANVLYAVSAALARDLEFAGRPRKPRIAIVPNAGVVRPRPVVDFSRIDGQRARIVRFVYLGVLQSYYDFELIVAAFRRARSWGISAELHFYGDGDQLPAVRRAAAGVDDIKFHGRYNLDVLLQSEVFNAESVLLLPSRANDMTEIGSPIKLFEYMSLGLPILASAVPQTQLVLSDNVTAVFYEPGNEQSCAAAMAKIAGNSALRAELGRSAHAEFLCSHTWDIRMGELLTALKAAGR